jgi:hypothetical protein
MRKLRALALTIASVTLLACETPTDPASQLLALSSDGSALTLTNPNSWPVFYMAVDPSLLAVASGTIADFALCSDPPSCPRVAAKSSVRVPYEEIAGYHAGQASVHITQWRLRRSSSGAYEPNDVQAVDANIQP